MPTKMTFGDVYMYMINQTTGEKTPVGSVSDAEITCDTETTDISEMVKTIQDAKEFHTEIKIDHIMIDFMMKLFNLNNYRRFHGKRALRWRKFDRTIYH